MFEKNFNKINLITIFLGTVIFTIIIFPAKTADAWYSDYTNRKSITVQSDNVDIDLTDFPVYINIDSDTDIGGAMQDTINYYDIRFTNTNDSLLPYELEEMSISSGEATGSFWIKTDLSSTTDTTLYMYYGKSGDTDGSAATSTWNSGFNAVWHLSEGDSTDADFYKDSTSNNNDGTLSDSNGDVTATSTQTGKGLNFIGTTNDRVNTGNNTSLNVTSTYTLSGWVKLDSYDSSGFAFLIAKDDYPSGGSYDLGLTGNRPYTAINTNPTGASWTTHTVADILPLSSWHYLTAVRNSDNTLDYYVDGAFDETFTGVTTPAVSTVDVTLGLRSADGLQLHGSIDELRIESVSREAEWIKFTHANMGGESDYELSFSSEQVIAPSSLSYTSPNTYTVNSTITVLVPTVTGIVDSYTVSPSLPAGLSIDSSTGSISGTPTSSTGTTTYTITATNMTGDTDFDLDIIVNEVSEESNGGGGGGPSIYEKIERRIDREEFEKAKNILLEEILGELNDSRPNQNKIKRLIDLFLSINEEDETNNESSETGELSQEESLSKTFNFTRDLYLDDEGDDVVELQNFLIEQNAGPATAELARVGATGYFYNYTKNSLGEYQKSVDILPHAGYFGPITKGYILNNY